MLLLSSIPLYANIDVHIDAIQNAPVEERFMLMNAFKKEVLHMQETERLEAITKLKSITQSRHSDRAIKELKKHAHPKFHRNQKDLFITKKSIERHLDKTHKIQEYIEDESENHIENETEEQIEDETEDHIENTTQEHIEDENEDHIENETEDHIEDEHDDD